MNAKMQQTRQAALDILKPNSKDLQHGTELHKNSIVIDTYGFGPGPASDTQAIRDALDAGLSDAEIQDLKESMPMLRHLTDADELHEYKEAWQESGVTCLARNAGEESQAPLILLKRLAWFVHVTDILRNFVPKVVGADDIINAHQAGRHCIFLTCNGIPLA